MSRNMEEINAAFADACATAIQKELAVEWLPKWREDLVYVLALMDEKGKSDYGSRSIVVWEDVWAKMRAAILSVADSIQEQQGLIECPAPGAEEKTDG